MQCPKCGFDQQDTNIECLSCGVIFHKYRENSQKRTTTTPIENSEVLISEEAPNSIGAYVKNLLFYIYQGKTRGYVLPFEKVGKDCCKMIQKALM